MAGQGPDDDLHNRGEQKVEMKKQNLILLTIGGLLNVACVIVPPGNTNNTTNHNYAPSQVMAQPQPAPRPIVIQQQAPRPIIVQQQAPQPPQVIRRYVYSQTPEQPRYCPPPQPRYYPQPTPQPRYYTYPQSSSSSMYYQGRNWSFESSSRY